MRTEINEILKSDDDWLMHKMMNDYFQNIGLKGLFKRYGVVNALRRGFFLANPIHCVKDHEIRKVLWQSNSANKIRPYLKYKNTDVEGIEFPAEGVSDSVWVYWDKGIENAPTLVKKCVDSIKQYSNRNVILLADNNLNEYIKLPAYIERKKNSAQIPMAAYADLIRFALLEHYGGTWIDSTVYLTDYIPETIMNSPFFAFRNSLFLIENPALYSVWFLHAKKGNKTIREIRNVSFAYWLKNKHVIEYLLPNLIVSLLLKEDPVAEKKIPYMDRDHSGLMLKKLGEEYNEQDFLWMKTLTSIHKLTYKLDTSIDKEGTIYRHIVSNV